MFALAFVFARVGAVMMLLPGFGEVFVSARKLLQLIRFGRLVPFEELTERAIAKDQRKQI